MKKSNILYACITALIVFAIVLYIKRDISGTTPVAAVEKVKPAATLPQPSIKEVALNEAQFKASSIELGTFTDKNLSEVINANGYTKLPPQNQADVSVYMGGIVKSINIIEGQPIRKGQTIATIESPEFTKIQEAYLTSKSNLEFLRLEFNRQKILSDEEVNSKKVFQRTKSEYEIEKARFSSLQRQMATLHINPNSASTSVVPVPAPISGFVTEINIKIGSNAEAGKPLVSIVDNTKLHVDLLVYEKDLHKVKTGQNVRFVLTNQDNSEIMGKIFSVGKAFENETKSVAVHADITNDKQKLIPGMYVNALIDIGIHKVKALPVEAIVKADGREFIFVLEEEHNDKGGKSYHFQRIEVKTGTIQLGYAQVTVLQELAADAKIVLKGAYYIQSHLLKSDGGGGHEH